MITRTRTRMPGVVAIVVVAVVAFASFVIVVGVQRTATAPSSTTLVPIRHDLIGLDPIRLDSNYWFALI